MTIRDLFERDIHRSINGVVKADQLDDSSVWQELDEFVITRELTNYIRELVDVLNSTMDEGPSETEKNGVWISGFFGSGKSHFIKVLSYLLENDEHSLGGESRRAIEFFEPKLDDALLLGDLRRVVSAQTDTILFNVDSKADQSKGRDALLRVFLKVLNVRQGYCGEHPHIAHMERHLAQQGKLEVFAKAFEREAGSPWESERDAYDFYRDQVVAAFEEATGQSKASAEAWVDNAEDRLSLSPENFAKWVKAYLDDRGENTRVMFLVDEVGQFIGGDTHLMLNLQTITEQLGTVCEGRAWVVVTAQEDLDTALGDLGSQGVKDHDFSKIQGRFKTRLSLSSANVDEVIKARLLKKKPEAEAAILAAYKGKEDILKNQLSFAKTGSTFKHFTDGADFVDCYPFPVYQFNLVQKVFQSIRKAGATGLHLSQGERSILDAFQSAAKLIGDDQIGALVPFSYFYKSVEGFLDTNVKRTIDQAREHHLLKPLDATVLEVLFLIRYVDGFSGTVDNLVTLFIDEIDADRLALKKSVEESLARLEKETLVARTGDQYFFLTNEERDIGREIKKQTINPGQEETTLGQILFQEVLGDRRKHTYSKTGRDFLFGRICDDRVLGSRVEGGIEVAIFTPLGERYVEVQDDQGASAVSLREPAQLLVRLGDHPSLAQELRAFIQTDAYVKHRNASSVPETTRRILKDRSEENRERRGRLVHILTELLGDASYFASGSRIDVGSSDPNKALGEALEYVIENAYPKMTYISHVHSDVAKEIQQTLRSNDVDQVGLAIESETSNAQALQELRDYLRLAASRSEKIVLSDMLKRFGDRPFGWPDNEVVLLVARLAVLREVDLVVNSARLELEHAYEHLTTTTKQRKLTLFRRESVDEEVVKKARALGKELFGKAGPSGEADLFDHLREALKGWDDSLKSYASLAGSGRYPGRENISELRAELRQYVEETDSRRFLNRFVDNKTELLDAADDYRDLDGFYTTQRSAWDALTEAIARLSQNELQLGQHPDAAAALRRMREISAMPTPYGVIREIKPLIERADQVNKQVLEDARGPALQELDEWLTRLRAKAEEVGATATSRTLAMRGLERLKETASNTESVAHIEQARNAAADAFDTGCGLLVVEGDTGGDSPAPTPTPRRTITPRELVPGGTLQSIEEVDTFMADLKAVMVAALEAGEEIRIR